MTKEEALKMAIEAMTKADNYFEQLCSLLITFGVSPSELNMQKDTFLIKPINACKEALEQPTVAELNDEYLRDTYVVGLNQPAWQGLTNDEIAKSIVTRGVPNCDWNEVTIDYLKKDIVAIARAIEQALKDKNLV